MKDLYINILETLWMLDKSNPDWETYDSINNLNGEIDLIPFIRIGIKEEDLAAADEIDERLQFIDETQKMTLNLNSEANFNLY